MLAFERHNKILELLYKDKKVTTDGLSKLINVSACTIRNDLNKLEKDGLIKRIHGGAVLPQTIQRELSFPSRKSKNQNEKNAIGKKAYDLVKDGQCIIIDASSTSMSFAKYLNKTDFRITVITNGIYTALELKDNNNINVILVGGVVRPKSGSLEGLMGKNLISQINADVAFLSARGFTMEEGLTEFNIYEAELKKLLISRARKVVAMLDFSKLEVNSISSFADSKQVDTIITDYNSQKDILEKYEKCGIDVIVAQRDMEKAIQD
ncbi:MAG: DeoR/GlpR family DNA-binding transcription regulator [Clostridium sp.]|jgi:DeoR/GlpR family transcriptional regulator of sugar metabolism|uniref:DeoR/GlpR family DNA-binding transcription regulator n=1 Tax=Clostridium sp. TaxID=1506 RepID=UPI0025BAA49B|nr:DeoR/GlpR family DNA-binding transcription regulator [Clostridium sp.]MCH3964643.1 DeoR/GlpR family DNA-binding transcription regulator [Clostridium sp.]MCI1715114.1 DeoR/GlpR family DNA-binding transcription regulator [Clostridium sp.]MCI1799376.1 DeoR/GlpR family DNA-binding transcription regulator [Clostridium sp.]MCI1813297.1 DeoR/GlpR family DNA-binding transcription regulator [Clostridium sp.]MCI1870188.1 DeoR/GlpR family DNA-binding transcription regulator [Clostridium sp.]